MAEYIERQAVLNLPQSITRNFVGEVVERSIDIEDIKDLPAADVAPVVHSTWIENGDPLMLTCGNCGYGVMRYNNTRFCPNCCANMDGGESDG